MQLREISRLDECYRFESDTLFITGLQALVRLLLAQRQRDARAGINTAGFVSGYRGSPLGGLDKELWRAREFLDAAHIRFQPGLNEDLAATSIWGTQQLNLFPGAKYDGVFGLWYGKGPGVDRSGDAFKHGNYAGTSKYGGVIVVAGDDHTCKSSSLPQQSEYSFIDAMMPVLNPADIQEVVDLGLYGYALSRFSGCWVGFKVIQETADATQTILLGQDELKIVQPEFDMPKGGLNIRWPDPPNDQEYRLQTFRLRAAVEFARVNRLNRLVIDSDKTCLGIVTTGKAHLDVLQALEDLGLSRRRASEVGIKVFKVGMSWPLEPQLIREFAEGLDEIIVVEEKRSVIEAQLKEQLYNWQGKRRPLIIGKQDEQGQWLLPSAGELTPARIARVLAARMRRFHSSEDVEQRVSFLEQQEQYLEARITDAERKPHFCSGCPHNTSTRVPEGSRAVAGIGCHFMAAWMDRDTVTYTQMGGEGATWIGQAPFTETPHVFQNIGDGTYAHSGILAIRAAVAAQVNITYKVLYNDAVAMTGGQVVEGNLTVARVAQQLAAEGVKPILIVSDHPENYLDARELPDQVTVHHRHHLDSLQRELREKPGVSALIYDQTCAAELHRKRKRGEVPYPNRRVVINENVCEGCGDCNIQSNCLSVLALETEFGRKRRINQNACNQDFSCLEGFCPSFVSLIGAHRTPTTPLANQDLPQMPEPERREIGTEYNVLIAGVGGTGVVTASGLIGLAAHLEGKVVLQLDQTGLAQKFGAVLSHVRIAADRERVHGMRIPHGQVDLLLGADLMIATDKEPLAMLSPSRSAVIVNTHEEMPPRFIRDPDMEYPSQRLLAELRRHSRPDGLATLDATRLASALLGDSIAANVFMLGFAFQKGLIPLSSEALYRALELFGRNVKMNKRTFDWGRYTAAEPDRVLKLAYGSEPGRAPDTLPELVLRRSRFLVDYQNEAYAARFRALVDKVAAAERAVRPASSSLALAAARSYFRLLAYKDEYEVARLHTSGAFLSDLRRNFGQGFKLKFHFSPPLFARIDPETGRPKKYEYGGWMLPVLRLLARLKFLRGTPFDVFGRSRERRVERQLIADYEQLVEEVLADLCPEKLDQAVEILALAESIKGYGLIKDRSIERYGRELKQLRTRWNQALPAEAALPAAAAAAG
jgi:indolepyruvate ferredoxin oxidoreductase